ncbi:MAG TPA: hypothetical protein VLS89_01775 [Candidatus Nanopelagicales bacterium]|nr:hypothetical protein [Candidatus Nanopelagicales bacterium]
MQEARGTARRHRARPYIIALITVLLALGVGGASSAVMAGGAARPPLTPPAQGPSYDDSEPFWVDGEVRHGYVRLFEHEVQGPDVDVFLVGTVNDDYPMETALRPGSPTTHDHVATHTPYGDRGRCHIYMVLPGPYATPETVRVRYPITAPGFEWVIHPYEIDLGDGFVPLVSLDVIEEGFAEGLLALSFDLAEGLSASCWSGGKIPYFPRYD